MSRYAESREREGIERLKEWNSSRDAIKGLTETPPMHHYDASGKTKDDRLVVVENKTRNQTLMSGDTGYYLEGVTQNGRPYTADTVMIETHKVASLLSEVVYYNASALYANFLNDDVVIMFNLNKAQPKYTERKWKVKSIAQTENRSKECYEVGDRMMLDINDGWIYKNNKLIKKGK